MTRYEEINKKFFELKTPGIFYAFSEEQMIEGMRRCGYKSRAGLVSDGLGGIGTPEAFKARREAMNRIHEEIKTECKPAEIFAYEWWNHESGYTGDYSEALKIARAYFPKYKPSKKLLHDLQHQFNAIN